MFKNLRNKLAVLALVAVGLAFGNALGSQPEVTEVTHDVLQLLGHKDGCSPEDAVKAVTEWINSEYSDDALIDIAAYNMTSDHKLNAYDILQSAKADDRDLDIAQLEKEQYEFIHLLAGIKQQGVLDDMMCVFLCFCNEARLDNITLGMLFGAWKYCALQKAVQWDYLPLQADRKIARQSFEHLLSFILEHSVDVANNCNGTAKNLFKTLFYKHKNAIAAWMRENLKSVLSERNIKFASDKSEIVSSLEDTKTIVVCMNDDDSLSFSWRESSQTKTKAKRGVIHKLILSIHNGSITIKHYGPTKGQVTQ